MSVRGCAVCGPGGVPSAAHGVFSGGREGGRHLGWRGGTGPTSAAICGLGGGGRAKLVQSLCSPPAPPVHFPAALPARRLRGVA